MADISKIKLGNTTYSVKDAIARDAINKLETAVSSSLVFKGVINTNEELDAILMDESKSIIGLTYKFNNSFNNSWFGPIQNGDMMICIKDDTLIPPYFENWTILQNNVDAFVGANENQDGIMGLVPASTKEDLDCFLSADGTWKNIAISWGKISDLIPQG